MIEEKKKGIVRLPKRATYYLGKYSIYILLVIFIIIASTLSPVFFTVNNFMNILHNYSVTGITALGMTFVLLIGGIDLSVGAVIALSGTVAATFIVGGMGVFPSCALAVGLCAVLGFINGFVNSKWKIPAFIMTLAMQLAARGISLLMTDGNPIYGLNKSIAFLGNGKIGPMYVSGIVWILLTVLSALVLRYTAFGRNLYVIGGNEDCAYLSGIKVKKTKTIVYVICAAFAAFAGIVMCSWLTVAQPTAAEGLELDAIAAAVLGGTSLNGGVGSIGGTFVGVILLAIITNIFNLLGVSSYLQKIFMGCIIVLALILNYYVAEAKEQ